MTSKLSPSPAPVDQNPLPSLPNNNTSSSEVANKANTVSMEKLCNVCNTPNSRNRCSRCKIYYCTVECQKKDWESGHKSVCTKAVSSVVQEKKTPVKPEIPENMKGKVDIITTTLSSEPLYYFAIREYPTFLGLSFWWDYISMVAMELIEKLKKKFLHSSQKTIAIDKTLFLEGLVEELEKIKTIYLQDRDSSSYMASLKTLEAFLRNAFKEGFFEVDNSTSKTFEESWGKILSSISSLGHIAYSKIDPNFVTYNVELPPQLMGTRNPNTLSCLAYAILKSAPHIRFAFLNFNKMPTIREFYELGYRSVLTPKEGDLVVYFSSETEPSLHAGIWTKEGLVESKPGNLTPVVVILHPLDCSIFHGKNIVVLRITTPPKPTETSLKQLGLPQNIEKHVESNKMTLASHPFEYFHIKEGSTPIGYHFWANCINIIANGLVLDIKKSFSNKSQMILQIDRNFFIQGLPKWIAVIKDSLQKEHASSHLSQLQNMEKILKNHILKISWELDNSSQKSAEKSWEKIILSITQCSHLNANEIDPNHIPHTIEIPPSMEGYLSILPSGPVPADMSCLFYALLKMNHAHAIAFFAALGKMPSIKEFYQAGYQNVSSPQDGDFIVYFKLENTPIGEQTKITHVGIWRDPGLIESKPGDTVPAIFILSPLDRSFFYGRHFAFLRKVF